MSANPKSGINDQVVNSVISPFLKTDWKPAPYRQLRLEQHCQALSTDGYFILRDFFSPTTVKRLNDLYNEQEHIGFNEIGMFLTAYSADIAYRKKIHQKMGEIIEPELGKVFQQFKPAVYNFVVKKSVPGVSLWMHQDLAITDENHASPINIWISMEEVSIESGPVSIVPKTQFFFPPHRSKITDDLIGKMSEQLNEYAVPITLGAGDLLVFDSRLIHCSLPNNSGKDRLGAMCHIYPEDAPFTMLVPSNRQNEFRILELEREDLFKSEQFESADKTGFKGVAARTVQLQEMEITPAQLTDYFSRVGVQRKAPSTAEPSSQSGSVIRNILSRLFR